MQENVGNMDRWLRVAVGGALVLSGARSLLARRGLGPGLLLMSGAILLETALTRVCPLNAALGVDTRNSNPLGELKARTNRQPERQLASGPKEAAAQTTDKQIAPPQVEDGA